MHAPTPERLKDDLERRFAYHPPKDEETKGAHEAVRGTCLDAAATLMVFCPPGREQSLMLTKLEEAMMWANAGIARAGSDKVDAEPASHSVGGQSPAEGTKAPDEGTESAAERF